MKYLLILFTLFAMSAEAQLKFGVSVPISGDLAEYGTAVMNAFKLAQEETPALARFQFVYDDNAYNAAKSLTSYKKLRDFDKVTSIYLWGEPGCASVAPVAEKDRFPFFSMSTDAVPALGKKFTIRTISDTDYFLKPVCKILKQKGVKKIAVVHTEDPFFIANIESLKLCAQPEISVEIAGSFRPDTQDFRSVFPRLRAIAPDAVGNFLQSGQAGTFFKQAEQVGFRSMFLGTDTFESREEMRRAGPLSEGAIYGNSKVDSAFTERYQKRFGNDAQISYAYIAHAFALTLPAIFPEGAATNGEDVVARAAKLGLSETNGSFEFRDEKGKGKFFYFPTVAREVYQGGVRDIAE